MSLPNPATSTLPSPFTSESFNGMSIPVDSVVVVSSNNVNIGIATTTISGNQGSTYVGSASTTFNITPLALADATIEVTNTAKTYNGSAQGATVTVKNGTSVIPATDYDVTYDGSTAIPSAVGSYAIAVTGKTDNVTGTRTELGTLTISAAEGTLTFNTTAQTRTYGDADFTFAATGNEEGTVGYKSDNESVATVADDGTVTIRRAGTATITAGVTGATNYSYTAKSYALTVNKATLTVTATAKKTTYGDDPAEGLTFGYSGFVNGEDETVLTTAPSVTIDKTAATAAGTYTGAVTVSGGEAANYDFSYVPATLTVGKADLGDVAFTVGNKDYNNGTAVTVSASDITAATFKGMDVDASEYTVTDSYTGNTGFGTATVVLNATGANFTGSQTVPFSIVRTLDVAFGGSNSYVTYYSDQDLELADATALNVYIVTGVSGSQVVTEEIDYIPAETGVLLERVSVSTFKVTKKDGAKTPADKGLLRGTLTDTALPSGGYVLYNNRFVLSSGGTLRAGRCYLPLSSLSTQPAPLYTLGLDADGAATAMGGELSTRSEVPADAAWYTVNGRRLSGKPSRKGLYIVNGQKTVIK